MVILYLREQIIEENHSSLKSGHMRIDKAFDSIKYDYFWPEMYLDIAEYVKSCLTCQKTKVSQQRSVGLLGSRIFKYPRSVVCADAMEVCP